jgi:hypothetical protein
MDIKKSLATKEGRIKLLQEIVKEATVHATRQRTKQANGVLQRACKGIYKSATS